MQRLVLQATQRKAGADPEGARWSGLRLGLLSPAPALSTGPAGALA